jgi:hypothetical protein
MGRVTLAFRPPSRAAAGPIVRYLTGGPLSSDAPLTSHAKE